VVTITVRGQAMRSGTRLSITIFIPLRRDERVSPISPKPGAKTCFWENKPHLSLMAAASRSLALELERIEQLGDRVLPGRQVAFRNWHGERYGAHGPNGSGLKASTPKCGWPRAVGLNGREAERL
jgi:hypothetical protein